jgi:uncharacterized protein YbbC (DUF1343 family)
MGIEFMVLDRPNPIGGVRIEGPALREGFESFVGIFHGPVRHGLTPGELAGLYREEHALDLPLAVMKMSGWRREMSYRATGLPWVPPSPNMPTEETALVYPGMCLLEGTNLSEGRGTATPFQAAGAPFVAAEELAERLNRQGLPGVRFRPVYFRPAFHKFAGEVCGGAFVHVTDAGAFRPFLTGVAFVKAARDLYPDDFRFMRGVYEFNDRHPAFDLLAGGPSVREMILAGASLEGIRASWEEDEREYRERKGEYHLYA